MLSEPNTHWPRGSASSMPLIGKAARRSKASTIKCTPAMEEALIEERLSIDVSAASSRMLEFDFNYVIDQCKIMQQLYTIKQRRVFAEALLKHERKCDLIVYYDETNFDLYCNNLQIQCAVSTEIGLVHHALQRGSIQRDVNAGFVDEIYKAVKAHQVFQTELVGKNTAMVLDNAPAHSQTEELVTDHSDLALLRLGPVFANRLKG
ncbi:LOW QUALITY PROTEIN: hypothetical protein PHMEG_0003504 [Phytophthora megakarya]|uniref:Tc1-like transposase DDE domain-containing protein n=1 Tax=Phytophthora megakarya TaxID=4795 RepID=A0A225WW62_9STRA|nr:LOW QUALITY PROTEIN: hypothetical protein PHMEG_0003504 [Phytophthora megakarya]